MIRIATMDDLDQLITLRMDYLQSTHESIGADEKDKICAQLREYIPRHIKAGDFIAVLAGDNGAIYSTAFLVMVDKPANPSFPNGRTGTVLNVFTYPEYRRRGLARQVVSHLIGQAQKAGLSQLELSATQAGRPLYEKLGFAPSTCPNMRLQLAEKG